ncbi:MAG: glutamyl-tRNA synthetase [Parcubacteria group bacterium Athens0714_26]|nr:MAG: glutamyl-tRNA synthetase [Parcubacteria group bacterium Athens0714_26]
MTEKKLPEIRVRIAPSPTGFFHIGTARTALFNWLFAKHNNGKFILRIEDTDIERSEKKYEEDILESLKWLGLKWDGELYRQSERLDIYEKYLKILLDSGKAYYCACTKEELEKEKSEMQAGGQVPRYSGKCRDLNIPPEKAQVIRFKMPKNLIIKFSDIIRGEITFDTSLIGDIAIAKNLKTALYNFAVVVDDYEMKISHVIRGEDHIANTPKQIALQEALAFPRSQYAHLPLILSPDRAKLSKRFAAVSVADYRKNGYLPEALINFIALLGWHSKTDKEIFNIDDLIKEFELERVQKAGAVFNIEKLNWLNSQYIKNSDNKRIKEILADIFEEKLPLDKINDKLINLSKDRMNKLSEFMGINDFFFELPDYPSELLIWKDIPANKISDNLKSVLGEFKNFEPENFNKTDLERMIMPVADKKGRGETLWPLRVALSGKDKSPNPFEILEVLGEKESMKRIEIALKKLKDLNG